MSNELTSWQEYPIEVLNLSIRPHNALRRTGICTLGQLSGRIKQGDLHEIRNFGEKSEAEVEEKLRAYLDTLPDVDTDVVFHSEPETLSPNIVEVTLCPVWHFSPIADLDLSPRLFRLLQKQGYTTLGQIAPLTEKTHPKDVAIKGFGVQQLENLKFSLETYLASLPESAFRLVDPTCEPVITPPNEINLSVIEDRQDVHPSEKVRSWFTSLYKEREWNVINLRYGLEQESLTLEEIGQKMGVTRERIRQIERRALQRLSHSVEYKTTIEQTMKCLRDTFNEGGGILTDNELVPVVAPFVPQGIYESGLLNLLAGISEQFKYDSQAEVWVWGNLPVAAIHRQVKRILRSTPVISEIEVFVQLQQTHPSCGVMFLQACLRTHPDIERTIDGQITFKTWNRRRKGVIIQALRQIGHPAHFTEITEVVNQLLPPEAQIEPHNIHAQIQRLADTFVWVERGTYGLAEWGLERSEFYPDIVERVLRESGHPLTVQETLTRVCEIRDCKESTVLMLLTLNPRFRAFPGDVYGLAEWRDEDFLDAEYREKRLLAAVTEDEWVNRRKPKHNVAQTLQDIDDLLSTARSENRVAELPLFYQEEE